MEPSRSLRWWNSRPILAALLAGAIALHNAEEWLAFPRFGEPFEALLRYWGMTIAIPPWPVLQAGLLIATLLPLALIWMAARGRRAGWKDAVLVGVAAVFLVNVFVPHLIAVVTLGGYAPGAVTALLLNLPICSLVIRHARPGGARTRAGTA